MYFDAKGIEELFAEADGIVLDMNGLIIDDESLQLAATNAALNPYGLSFRREDWSSHCVGRKAEEFVRDLLTSSRLPLGLVRGILEEKEANYRRYLPMTLEAIVRPGVREFIHPIACETGKTLALASSATDENVDLVLGEAGLCPRESFAVVVSGEDVARAKPDPEIFLAVARALPHLQTFLVFEDSHNGVLAAQNAGMDCIAVPNSFTQGMDFSGAQLVISDLSREARVLGHLS